MFIWAKSFTLGFCLLHSGLINILQFLPTSLLSYSIKIAIGYNYILSVENVSFERFSVCKVDVDRFAN